MDKKNSNNKKEYKLGLIVLCISILIGITSVSYAVWTQLIEGKTKNSLTTAKLDIDFQNEENEINLEDAIPVSDSKGINSKEYVFELKNTGTIDSNYRLSLVYDEDKYEEDNCQDKKLEFSNIKYVIKELDSTENTANNVEVLNENNGNIYEGEISSGEVKKFSLKLWIKSDADNSIMGKHFHTMVKVEGIQKSQSFDD